MTAPEGAARAVDALKDQQEGIPTVTHAAAPRKSCICGKHRDVELLQGSAWVCGDCGRWVSVAATTA